MENEKKATSMREKIEKRLINLVLEVNDLRKLLDKVLCQGILPKNLY